MTPLETLEYTDAEALDAITYWALHRAGCDHGYIELFALKIRPHLELRPDGTVRVLDDAGNIRFGITPDLAAWQLRAEYDQPGYSRFFHAVQPQENGG